MTPSAQGEAAGSVRLTKNPVCSLSCLSYQRRGISLKWFPRLRQTVDPVLIPFLCVDSSLRRAWNTKRSRLGLGPDRTASYPLHAVHKPAPTVAGDRRDDAESAPQASSPPPTRTHSEINE